ncbi:MAG TPA: hypothetical protein VE087_10825 [Xanthobacteraceae bacterium]|nr:hypothetical protein [Xanthobacteraceae bacterium]
MKHRIAGIARGESFDIAARFALQDVAPARIARSLTQQRRGQHPRALDARQIAVMRRPAHIADPPFRVAASQPDEAREKPGKRARARQSVVVDAQSQIAVSARRIRREQPAIDVAHRFRVFRRAEAVPMLLALAGPVAERRGQPEIRGGARRAGARHRHAEQRVDALQREVGGIERRGPPDVGARLEDDRRGIGGFVSRQRREVGRRAFEISAIQRVETGAQI